MNLNGANTRLACGLEVTPRYSMGSSDTGAAWACRRALGKATGRCKVRRSATPPAGVGQRRQLRRARKMWLVYEASSDRYVCASRVHVRITTCVRITCAHHDRYVETDAFGKALASNEEGKAKVVGSSGNVVLLDLKTRGVPQPYKQSIGAF